MAMLPRLFGSTPDDQRGQAQALVEGNTAFAFNLYRNLKDSGGNLFFSPYSISTALAITYAGARGNTEEQMGRVLGFGADQRQIHPAFGELQTRLLKAGRQQGIELSIANALWVQKGHPFLPAFMEIAQGDYQANINQADFDTAAEAARGEVNRWVLRQTKDRISNILPPGSLNDLTRLVLANAIYFKGVWAKPYDEPETSTQPFHLSATRQAEVPLMHQFESVGYMEESGFQAVDLPYKGGELSMVILLPRQVDGCAGLENKLTPALLSLALGQMKEQKVEIFLPKFKLESFFDLSETLAKMGMPDAFGPKSDFSGIDGSRLLYISGVFHKSWVEVNEEGTEAAAATAVFMGTWNLEAAPPVFRADHPFIFLIRDTRSGTVLFLGRMSDPT